MLISALCEYCDELEKKGKLPPEGYEKLGISYLIELDEDGNIVGISDRRVKKVETVKGKTKEVFSPKEYQFPKRPRTTSICAHYVEVRGGYLFGLEYRKDRETGDSFLSTESDGKTAKQKEKLHLQQESFRNEVAEDFADIVNPSPVVKAYVNFAAAWDPDKQQNNSHLLALGKDLNTAKFAFCAAGHPEEMLQDNPEVIQKWNLKEQETSQDSVTCQCAVTGRILPVVRTHNTLVSGKGVGVANAGTNPSLVNFNCESFLSYGHKQGENGCISVLGMKKYTRALNWLLSDPHHHRYLDELTLVYWAADVNEANDNIVEMLLFGPSDQNEADELNSTLDFLLADAGEGNISFRRMQEIKAGFSPDTDYYMVALAPNSSRIQVKFIYRQQFGRLIENIARHQSDMRIVGSRGTVPLWKIKRELVSPKSSHPEKLDAMFLTVLKSIIQGSRYPTWLMETVVQRVRKDRNSTDEDRPSSRLNPVRAGIIKACITRQTKEVVTVALDRNNTNQAYLCGRLFAVLQKIQEDSAYPQKLNRTIEDSYFSSASRNPAAVMPKLCDLSRHHMAKLRRSHPDWAVNDSKQINEIVDKLGVSFPGNLGLYEQGKFILGYYQQNAVRYEGKKGETENAEA